MRRKTFLSLLFLFSLGIVLPASALTVRAPDQAILGVPFPVEVSGTQALTGVSVGWMGRTLVLERSGSPEKPLFHTSLVCPVLKGSAGRQILVIAVTWNGEVRKFPWQVNIADRSFPVTDLRVAPSKAVPPPEALERIQRERREAERVMSAETLPARWSLPLSRPVDGIVTSPYGTRRIFNGKTRSRHSGIDFRASTGTPVRSVSDGTVVLTGDRYFSGRTVFVDHGAGWISLYGHLSEISVCPGQPVRAGEVLGLSGATGRVTGPHLHFGLCVHGQMADAMSLFSQDREAFSSVCREVSLSLK